MCDPMQVKYDKDAVEVDLLQPAFTRRREVFIGRLAMVGFVSAVLGEVGAILKAGLHSHGITAQMQYHKAGACAPWTKSNRTKPS